MEEKLLFNDGWEFCLTGIGDKMPADDSEWKQVEIPHDWLIWNAQDLYRDGDGWYRKRFDYVPEEGKIRYLRFDGVYMDCVVWINKEEAFTWKYGYSTFTIDCTRYLQSGENEIIVRVRHQAPNSRWYSGAGIYRNVWIMDCPKCHIVPDGVYITPRDCGNGMWEVAVDTEVEESSFAYRICHCIVDASGKEIVRQQGDCHQILKVEKPQLWDLDSPVLYRMISALWVGEEEIQTVNTTFGFRTLELKPDSGVWLNGRRRKLNGVCQHHDLGCLGTAFNENALRRQFVKLVEMGVNAIRVSHNMPAPEFMQLADEMGILICSEAFDMWRRSKTTYDYARFFDEWAYRDIASWVRRDRNHPSLIFWSIGNEIYDTHADSYAVQLTRELAGWVRRHDPQGHAFVTMGSNYMSSENAQNCAEYVEAAGYNYGERMYEEHHRAHPDWVIYGSETGSVVQSRGIYHFPLRQQLLSDDDEQCSSLGNSATSWGAKSTELCILNDYRAEFSAGQFVWTGTDYIGEPTPYHTRSAYFGQIDTAGFPKDSFYIYQSGWTDYRTAPMIHVFPYWDFSVGQQIDVRICSNAPQAELFLNGVSQGRKELGLDRGKLLADYRLNYEPGELTAVAYNEEGKEIARDSRKSFGEPAALLATADRGELQADGRSLAFVTISAVDRQGRPVENAVNRVHVRVEGAGRLMGLDNGDSTDPEPYKTDSRRMFSGKLLAVVGSVHECGEITVTVTSPGLAPVHICLQATESMIPAGASRTLQRVGKTESGCRGEIPVRKIELTAAADYLCLTPEQKSVEITARLLPENASYGEVEWAVTNAAGIPSPAAVLEADGRQARLTAIGDGEIWVRCMSRNGRENPCLISQLCFTAQGFGEMYLDPYGFISGGLYTYSNRPLNNGNERGAATPPEGESHVGFSRVDFGEYGSDLITLPLFSLTQSPFPVEIWTGIPGKKDAEHLATVTYTQGSVYNTYLEQTFRLPRRLKGVTDITFVFRQKVHLKGFSFERQTRAYEKLPAVQCDALYGDSFEKTDACIQNIGNNVTVSFRNMEFTAAPSKLVISGRTRLESNAVHLHFKKEGQEDSIFVLDFERAEKYTERCFTLKGPDAGNYDVDLVFLPGSCFDLAWIRFEKE